MKGVNKGGMKGHKPTITRFWNKYRGMVGFEGEYLVFYFDTEKEARDWQIEMWNTKMDICEPGVVRTKKNIGAKHQDLSIGIYETVDKKTRLNGSVYEAPTIITTINDVNGHKKYFTATYGNIRTREEAIDIVETKRYNYVLENPKLFDRKIKVKP